jgi:hypothetical protein
MWALQSYFLIVLRFLDVVVNTADALFFFNGFCVAGSLVDVLAEVLSPPSSFGFLA